MLDFYIFSSVTGNLQVCSFNLYLEEKKKIAIMQRCFPIIWYWFKKPCAEEWHGCHCKKIKYGSEFECMWLNAPLSFFLIKGGPNIFVRICHQLFVFFGFVLHPNPHLISYVCTHRKLSWAIERPGNQSHFNLFSQGTCLLKQQLSQYMIFYYLNQLI